MDVKTGKNFFESFKKDVIESKQRSGSVLFPLKKMIFYQILTYRAANSVSIFLNVSKFQMVCQFINDLFIYLFIYFECKLCLNKHIFF